MNERRSPVPSIQTETDFIAALSQLLDRPIDSTKTLRDLGVDSFSAVQLQRDLTVKYAFHIPLGAFMSMAAIAQIFAEHSNQLSANNQLVDPTPHLQASLLSNPDWGPWPLTPVQSAYWVGRGADYPLGGVSTRFYQEFELQVPDSETVENFVARLETAWNEVVQRHPMLRSIITRDGHLEELAKHPKHAILTYRAAPDDPDVLIEQNSSNTVSKRELTHACPPLDQWPIHTLGAILDGTNKRITLCMGFDVLLLDLPSIIKVLHDWSTAFSTPGSLQFPTESFGKRMLLRQQSSEYQHRLERSRHWWETNVHKLPPGPLPLDIDLESPNFNPPTFQRHEVTIPKEVWDKVKQHSQVRGHSPSITLAAAFACALRIWGARTHFALNTTVFDPDGLQPNAPLGDYTRTTLIDMCTCDTGTSFQDYVASLGPNYWSSIEHADIPVHEILRIRNSNSNSVASVNELNPLEYAIVFTSALGEDLSSSWFGSPSYCISQTPQVLLDAIHYESNGQLVLAWDAVQGAFDSEFLQGMQTTMKALVNALVDDTAWDDHALLADPWIRQQHLMTVLPQWDNPSIAAGFSTNNQHSRQCIIGPGNTITGDEIEREIQSVINGIATTLTQASSSQPILVIKRKSPQQITTVIGIVHAGHSYIPVDPAWPEERVTRIAQRSGARFAFCDDDIELPAEIIKISPEHNGETNPPKPVSPNDLAYTIFTSGSTGEPKGVAIEHGQARTTIDEINRRFSITDADTVFGISALSFDLSVWDIFGVLGAGGGLALPDPQRAKDPQHWLDVLDRAEVTIWNSAPPLMEMLIEYAEIDPVAAARSMKNLRLVLLSGDWIPVTLPQRIRKLAPRAQVISLGGATEAAIWSLCFDATHFDATAPSVPYGEALKGQWFRILNDDATATVPPGVPGHLYIGGAGVAREYLGDPKQTNERFIEHPALQERLYNTGDMGMWLNDGNIRFLGRDDRQVKINGFRIELGEIDAALTRNSAVRLGMSAAPKSPDGRRKLVAYVVPATGSTLDETTLKRDLRTDLPDYMVPSHIMLVPELPVTDNGKIDYRNLPLPWNTDTAQQSPTNPEPQHVDHHHLLMATLESLDPQSTPLAAGIDSLTLVRIANAIEDTSGTRPKATSLLEQTIGELLNSLREPNTPNEIPNEPRPTQPVIHHPSIDIVPPFKPVDIANTAPATTQNTQKPHDLLAQALSFGGNVSITIPTEPSGSLGEYLGNVAAWLQQLDQRGIEYDANPAKQPDQLYTITFEHKELAISSEPIITEPLAASAPLTELQLSYYLGRADQWLGQPVAPYYYTEVDCTITQDELQRALDKVIAAHPALLLGVQPDGTQRSDPRCTPHITINDLRHCSPSQQEQTLTELRKTLRRGTLQPEGKPWLNIHLSLLGPSLNRLHLGIDMLFCDVLGAQILAHQLKRALTNQPLIKETEPFLSHARLHTPSNINSFSDIPTQPYSVDIPFEKSTDTSFHRKTIRFSDNSVTEIKAWSTRNSSTLDATILTAISFAVAKTSSSPLPPIITTVLQRPRGHENTVGEYTSTILLEFSNDEEPSFQYHAKQTANTLLELVLDNDQSHHGNNIIRQRRTVTGEQSRFPLVYSSGLTTGSNTSELLSELGTTVFSISETPQVLVDVQSFFDGQDMVLNIDYPVNVVPASWISAFAQHLEHTLTNLHEPPTGVILPSNGNNDDNTSVTIEKLRSMVSEILGRTIQPHEDSAGFFDLGLTSVDLITLHRELQTQCHIEISVLDIFAHPNINALHSSFSETPGQTLATTRGAKRRTIATTYALD